MTTYLPKAHFKNIFRPTLNKSNLKALLPLLVLIFIFLINFNLSRLQAVSGPKNTIEVIKNKVENVGDTV